MYVRSVAPARWTGLDPNDRSSLNPVVQELVGAGYFVSVYESNSQSETEFIAVALSAQRHFEKHFRYVEIQDSDLSAVGVEVSVTSGNTPLPEVNSLHRDLDLSGTKALELVKVLAQRGVTVERIPTRRLKALASQLSRQGTPLPKDSWLLT